MKRKTKDTDMRPRNLQVGRSYYIVGGKGVNPKLAARALQDGRDSLYLEYYLGFGRDDDGTARVKRRRENLSLHVWAAPRTPAEREQNKEIVELAKRVRFEREQQVLSDTEGYRVKRQKVNFLDYFQDYIDNYTKKDKRNVGLALRRFKDFLRDTPEYSVFQKSLKPEQLTRDMVQAYAEYLQSRSVGSGAHTIYARFKKVVKYAVEHDVFKKNPCTGISIKVDERQLKKDVLTQEEVQTLVATHYTGENPDIRRAFIMSLYTGMRWCDVKDLTFANVDYSSRLLRYDQNKTTGHSANSGVIVPLTDGLLALIGEPPADRGALIFPLPSHTMCLKALRHWMAHAGIDKHITWHCARHSFAVNILNNGANIKTVASLLGHSGLKYTEVYTRAVDSLKQAAIESLPELKL